MSRPRSGLPPRDSAPQAPRRTRAAGRKAAGDKKAMACPSSSPSPSSEAASPPSPPFLLLHFAPTLASSSSTLVGSFSPALCLLATSAAISLVRRYFRTRSSTAATDTPAASAAARRSAGPKTAGSRIPWAWASGMAAAMSSSFFRAPRAPALSTAEVPNAEPVRPPSLRARDRDATNSSKVRSPESRSPPRAAGRRRRTNEGSQDDGEVDGDDDASSSFPPLLLPRFGSVARPARSIREGCSIRSSREAASARAAAWRSMIAPDGVRPVCCGDRDEWIAKKIIRLTVHSPFARSLSPPLSPSL